MSPTKNPPNPKRPKTTPDDLRRHLIDLKLPFMREHVEHRSVLAGIGEAAERRILSAICLLGIPAGATRCDQRQAQQCES